MKCKLTGKVMNDQDPPFWIPLNRTQQEQEEADKIKKQEMEQKIRRGYLICKSALDSLPEHRFDQK